MLRLRIRERNSLVCVGLDVDPGRIPASLKNDTDPVFVFNREIIRATRDLVLAYKPNLAFYESLGTEGWDILRRTLSVIPDDVIKIGDAKRGDIGNTADRYARALFSLGFDAVTVNPYMGFDSMEPFIRDSSKGIFILCLTSNPGSKDFQYLLSDSRPLYLHVAEKARTWNKNGNCGLVTGATHPDELQAIRETAGELPFLIPGIGAQGGDLGASVLAGTDQQGSMAVINSSRGILYASSGPDFAVAAAGETRALRDSINSIRRAKKPGVP
ncbi:orotidine-5'-phosphate decarboxylase [bacterium]|nr:orotidine-5'-phosphate decarboxylase [bacterium]